MYFTKEDYERILSYILQHSKKDTDFEKATELQGEELLAIVQNNENKTIAIEELLRLIDEEGITIMVAQDEGESSSKVMSQSATTDSLNDIRDIIDLDPEKGTVQQQIDDINTHIGGPSEESIQSQIDSINDTIGGESEESIQNQLQSLRDSKLDGDDIVDDLNSSQSNKVLSANQGRIIQGNINSIQSTVDTFVHSTIEDQGIAIYVSGQVLNLEFTPIN